MNVTSQILIVVNNPSKIEVATDNSIFIAHVLSNDYKVYVTYTESFEIISGQLSIALMEFSEDWLTVRTLPIRNAVTSVFNSQSYKKIFYRADVPQDIKYVQALQLFNFFVKDHKNVVNNLSVLLSATSKTELLHIDAKYRPNYLISCSQDALKDWLSVNNSCVLKPINNALSTGVSIINRDKPLHQLGEKHFFIAEDVIPDAASRELRLWFINAKLFFAVMKQWNDTKILQYSGNFCLNICELTNQEQETVTYLESYLSNRQINMIGIDLVQGYITDMNFESPGLLREGVLLLGLQNELIEELDTLINS